MVAQPWMTEGDNIYESLFSRAQNQSKTYCSSLLRCDEASQVRREFLTRLFVCFGVSIGALENKCSPSNHQPVEVIVDTFHAVVDNYIGLQGRLKIYKRLKK